MRALTASLRALLLAAATFAPLGLGGTNPGATYPGTNNGRLAFGMTVDGNMEEQK